MANAKANYDSSKQSQLVTVNIQGNYEQKNDYIVEVQYEKPVVHRNYANLPPDINTLLQDKDRQLEALNIIIHTVFPRKFEIFNSVFFEHPFNFKK